MASKPYTALLNYCMRALTRRAHTEFEMRQKLQKYIKKYLNKPDSISAQDFDQDLVDNSTKELEDAVIARLKDLKFIDDTALIESAIHSSAEHRLEGKIKLAARLRKKGISFSETSLAWKESDLSEREIAIKALLHAQKRFARLPREKLFQRKAQFLASRGFSPEIIFELARKDEIA